MKMTEGELYELFKAQQIIKQEKLVINNVEFFISTVFFPINFIIHPLDVVSEPYFATKVFREGSCTCHMKYRTLDEAKTGHEQLVGLLSHFI